MKIKKNDKVLVIAGKDRGKTGVVTKALPKDHKVVIEGINIVKKHLKRSTQNPQGGIIEKTLPIDVSNVMLLEPGSNKPTRISYVVKGDKKQRITKRSKEVIQ